jgi:hypothetical protein
MTDLINRIDKLIKEDIESVQAIINKFSTVLQDTRPEKEIPYLAIIINICVNYINANHKDLSPDIKAWSVIIVRHQYLKGKIKNDTDILKTIDDFVAFWKTNYKKYCKDIIAVTEYGRDRGFVHDFILKKNR